MEPQQPTRLKTTRDWHEYLNNSNGMPSPAELLSIRQQCYREIENYRDRPLLVYAAKLDVPKGAENYINLLDVDGFTELVNSVDRNLSAVDVLLHSPGGMADATERLVGLLRGRFEEVNFLIPHSAYSAATMLALSGNCVILHPSATLGPIDPQINGIPARSITRGFEKAKEVIAAEGPKVLPAYLPLIEKCSLELFELCYDSEKLSKKLVSAWLKEYMFKGKNNISKKIKKAVEYLSNYDLHLTHSRPLSSEKLIRLGLKIELADETLRDLLWEAHIATKGFFDIGPFVKLYENAYDVSWGRTINR